MPTSSRNLTAALLLWTGRALAVLLALFWGAFFVDHLSEWFLRPDRGLLPTFVWVVQGFHGLMILGLALMLRWERLGAAVVVLGMIGFALAAGNVGILVVLLVNLLPIVCFAALWVMRRPRAIPAS